MIKVVPAIAGLASASALTSMLFGNNLREFLVNTSGDGSQRITLRELLGVGGITNYGIGGGGQEIGEYIRRNIADNWMNSVGVLILAKALPKVLSKTGVTRGANKLSKAVGMESIVQM